MTFNIPELNSFINEMTQAMPIESILCYGSYPAGLQDKKSDIDLLIIVDKLPPIENIMDVYTHLKCIKKVEKKDIDTCFDSSWTLANAQLETHSGLILEPGFNTKKWINKVIKKTIDEGQITFKEFPFRPYTFLGLLETCTVLYDKNKFISKIKKKIRPFPPKLKKDIIQTNLNILKNSFGDLKDCHERGIGILAYQFHISMALDAAIQVLWALNDIYDPASKRSEYFLFKLNILPDHFEQFLHESLPNCFLKQDEFIKNFEKIVDFIQEQARSSTIY